MTYYDEIAPSYNQLYGEEKRKKLECIKQYIKEKRSDKILDIGSGTALAAEYFNCQYTGIDPSQELLRQTKENVIVGKAEELPFEDNFFDILLCITAIHNFEDPEKALQEMKRVLKKEGKLVITLLKRIPSYEFLKNLIFKHVKGLQIREEEKDIIFLKL